MSHHEHVILPVRTYLMVFGALLFLTVATVWTAVNVELGGSLDLGLAIVIATIKASLVGAYFMMLKYDNPMNTLTILIGASFLVVFIGITMLDTEFRGEFDVMDRMPISEQEIFNQNLENRDAELPPVTPYVIDRAEGRFGQ